MGTRFEWFSRSGYDRETGKSDKPRPDGEIEVQEDGSLRVAPEDDYPAGFVDKDHVQLLVREIFGKLPKESAGELVLKIAADMLDKAVRDKQVAPETVTAAENDDLLLGPEALCQEAAGRVLEGGNLLDVDRTGVSVERVLRHVAGILLETMSTGIAMGKSLTDVAALVLAPKLMQRARVLTEGIEYFKDAPK